ncbi:MAG: N-acetyltransferase [Bacteroidales bacterium]|nr:N-acetyltransferase [Bacteroidales bacterium]
MIKGSYFVHESSYVDEICEISDGTKIWHFLHIMSNCKIGKKYNIGQNVIISPDIILEMNVKVQNNVSIFTGVVCEDDLFSKVFTNVINPRSAVNRKNEYLKTKVCKGATIGANATIVSGHDIGEYVFIGAGSVITKDVKPYALFIGNPTRQNGWISEFDHKLIFNNEGIAICPESNERYLIKDNSVNKL